MTFDIKMIKAFYKDYANRVEAARTMLGRPMTLAEKILYAHLHEDSGSKDFKRGTDYVFFSPDRVAMQDATAQMALMQFTTCGRKKVAVPSTVHCDHLIQAKVGATADLVRAEAENSEMPRHAVTVATEEILDPTVQES